MVVVDYMQPYSALNPRLCILVFTTDCAFLIHSNPMCVYPLVFVFQVHTVFMDPFKHATLCISSDDSWRGSSSNSLQRASDVVLEMQRW